MARPLADRMRPVDLSEVVGQERWLNADAPLRRAIDEGQLRSLVLWGPPGCGKTTIARALAAHTDLAYVQISAVLDGVKQLRGVIDEAQGREDQGTLLFVDEIHRWNKSQQDALLPHVESGLLLLVGATTENPSFQLNAALRSRVQVVHLDPLTPELITDLLKRALIDPRGYGGQTFQIHDSGLEVLARLSAGDARRALSDLERCIEVLPVGSELSGEWVIETLQRSDIRHDRSGEDHFNVVSALIKSMRGSDPDAALYWLARMIEGGEDPVYIARRLIVFASEDVGNADPRALTIAVDAARAMQLIGLPEGRIVLGQAITWLACCPKSNASYLAIDRALGDVRRHGALAVPLHLRNGSTALMKEEGYGVGYLNPHEHPHHIVKQEYLPQKLRGRRYYEPAGHGDEKTIRERLAWWRRKLEQG